MTSDANHLELRALVLNPREELSVELKGWLDLSNEVDKANLAKALMALANSGGGFVLLGFRQDGAQWATDGECPASLNLYSQDAVNGIVARYAEPSFQCDLYQIPGSKEHVLHPVIRVPGNHRVPIRAKRDDPERKHVRLNAYYIRRQGPSSDQPRDGLEWDQLIRRCMMASKDDLLSAFRNIFESGGSRAPEATPSTELAEWDARCRSRFDHLVQTELAAEVPSRYRFGVWTVSYKLIDPLPEFDLASILRVLDAVRGYETGWPPWWVPSRPDIKPYSFDGEVECWIKDSKFGDAAHSDFWRASPQGMLYLLRGYQEDEGGAFEPGTTLVVTAPIYHTAEVLLHASRVAQAVAPHPRQIVVRTTWQGLSNRTLGKWAGFRYDMGQTRRCRQDSITAEKQFPLESIVDSLPELVHSITLPLFQAFDFYSPPVAFVSRELTELLKSSR